MALRELRLKAVLGVPDSAWLGQININFSSQLGVGSDATVHQTVYDGLLVAGKVLHNSLIEPGVVARTAFIRKFGQECSRLRQLSHPCVVSFIGVGQAPNYAPCLIMELMEESLAQRLLADPPDPFLQSLSYLKDVAAGLRYVHWMKVIHRDLKPENILIAAGSAKITDVGLARSLHGDDGMATQVMSRCPGTPDYMAPESFEEGRVYDEKLDVFGVGCIVLAVFTHHRPNPKMKEVRVLANGSRIPMSELERRRDDVRRMHVNHPARPLVITCLQDDPALRPTAVQVHQQLMIIQRGFGGTDKPLLSGDLSQVLSRLDNLATAQQEHHQQLAAVRTQLQQQQLATQQEFAEVRTQLQQQLQQQKQESQRGLATLRQEIRSQQAANIRVVGDLCSDVTAPCRDVEARPQVTQTMTVPSPPTARAIAATASVEEVPLLQSGGRFDHSEYTLTWEFLRDVVSKRQWVRRTVLARDVVSKPSVCSCGTALFVAFSREGRVSLYRTADLEHWDELPCPETITECHGLVTTNQRVCMLYHSADTHYYVASIPANGSTRQWEISPTPCPVRLQNFPTLAAVDSTIYLLGNSVHRDRTVWYNMSTRKWAKAKALSVPRFPKLPQDWITAQLALRRGQWYLAVGVLGHSDYTPTPSYVLAKSRIGHRWQETGMRAAPQSAGLLSHNDWLWYVGGFSAYEDHHRRTGLVYCIDPATNDTIALPTLQEGRSSLAVAACAGKVVALGGFDTQHKWHGDVFTLDISV